MNNLRFEAENFTTQLPVAYYCDRLDLSSAEDIYNFEVNALPSNGIFELEIRFKPEVKNVQLSLQRGAFRDLALENNNAVIQVNIDHRLLSFDVRVPGWNKKELPLDEVRLTDCESRELEYETFKLYQRDTKLSDCNLITDWSKSYAAVMEEDFPLSELENMRNELTTWIAERQVLDKSNPHYGAVYSEEDKYCFRDAIFAACCFMREYLRTGQEEWYERACLARDYCYRGQYRNTGDSGKDGCWAAMGIIDDKSGSGFRRITDKWAQSSGVDTALIAIQSDKLHRMGMSFSPEHLDQLAGAVSWNLRNMVAPGWFSHHEGMDLYCLNMNSLGASMFYAVHRMFLESGHPGLSPAMLSEAETGFQHVLKCQEAIGVYPYRPFSFKRGGAYNLQNLPDNGIGLQAAMAMIRNPHSPFSFAELKEPMRRTALWYLSTSRFAKGHLVLDYSDDPEFFKGLAFGNFTWCRITMLDIISQLGDDIGDKQFWQQFCRCHLRTIRETLWNYEDNKSAPIKAAIGPVKVVSWIQQAEWAAYVFDNLAMRFGIIPKSSDEIN
jgi:hypothetical protein